MHKNIPVRLLAVLLVILVIGGLVSLQPAAILQAGGTITGVVFSDYNANGERDAGEPGIAGVTVTAYNNNGPVPDLPVVTDSSGNYTLVIADIADPGPWRVEFSTIPSFLQPGAYGLNNTASPATDPLAGTTVQFVAAGGTANLALQDPSRYCDTNARLISACYVNGDPTEPAGGATYPSGGLPWLVGVPAFPSAAQTGPAQNEYYDGNTGRDIAPVIGATWGIVYQRTTQTIYAAAVVKRHTGLGANGVGAIYRIAPTGTTPVPKAASLLVDLNTLPSGVLPATAALLNPGSFSDTGRGLTGDAAAENRDVPAFDGVGKQGFGGMDITADERFLYAMNLNTRALVRIDVGDATPNTIEADDLAAFAVPTPAPACADGVFRPWAVKVHEGQVYVGGVCSGQTEPPPATENTDTSDLEALIYRFDPATDTFISTPVIRFPLNYPRGVVTIGGANSQPAAWQPWISQWSELDFADEPPFEQSSSPQPILMSLAFDRDNSIVVGLGDRAGMQLGNQNFSTIVGDNETYEGTAGGDMLRICNTASGYQLENGGVCPPNSNAFNTPGQGPGGAEYYGGDSFGGFHQEVGIGGIALLPGVGELVTTAYDPRTSAPAPVRSGGMRWLSNASGNDTRGYLVFGQDGVTGTGNTERAVTFGKAAGLGGIAPECLPAPIEIGNRLWRDTNNNGIQDPNEAPIADVTVRLYDDANNLIGTAITDSNGQYLFSNDNTGTRTGSTSFAYGITGLQPNRNYQVRLDDPTDYTAGNPLNNLSLTTQNASSPAGASDSTDSDGALVVNPTNSPAAGTFPVINLTTGPQGANNHTHDFGFVAFEPVSLGNRIWYDTNNDGLDNDGNATPSQGISGVTVELFLDADRNGLIEGAEQTPIAREVTDANGYYIFTSRNLDASGNPIAPTSETPLNVGDYVVGIPGSNFGSTGPLRNLYSSGSTAGANGAVSETPAPDPNTGGNVENPGIDSDDNGNKQTTGFYTNGVLSQPVQLRSNEPTGESEGTAPLPNTTPDGTPIPDTFSNLTIDFGFYGLSLGNLVWLDDGGISGTANNGLFDTTENPIPGVTVRLIAADGTTVLSTTVTDASGKYLFTNLAEGTYIVEVDRTSPALTGLSSSTDPADANNPVQTDSDDNGVVITATTVRSVPVVLSANDESATFESDQDQTVSVGMGTPPAFDNPLTPDPNSNLYVDFGFLPLYSLGNRVWFDTNNNGQIDSPSEGGINGINVRLLNSDGSVYDSNPNTAGVQELLVVTGNGSYYRFDDLLPGDYRVEIVASNFTSGGLLVGYRSSDDISSSTNPNTDIDSDDNGVGSLPSATEGVRSAVITLGPSAAPEPTTDTDRPASYAPGSVTGVEAPDNRSNLTVDFGFYRLTVGNQIWVDTNSNTTFESGTDITPAAVQGLTIELRRPDNSVVARTTTDSNGQYLFTQTLTGEPLAEGTYYVAIPNPPAGYSLIGAGTALTDNNNQGSAVGSEIRTGSFTLDAGSTATGQQVTARTGTTSQPTLDIGLFQTASIGNRVWLDQDRDGVQDAGETGVTGITVRLLDANGVEVATTTTGADGIYSFDNLRPGEYAVQFDLPPGYSRSPRDAGGDDTTDSDADLTTGRTINTTLLPGENDPSWDAGIFFDASLGDRVWLDQNANGIQDAGEPGVANVTVILRDGNGTEITRTTTDTDGNYAFSGLQPGTYQVEFVPPAGLALTQRDVGSDDAADSDADLTTGRTTTITLGANQNDPRWDAGLVQLLSLGNLVWTDLNNNGTVDAGEPGVANVPVRLYQDANSDGIPDGAAIQTTSTDANGNYLFTNLLPGNYLVEITPPAGYSTSTGQNGSASGSYETAPGPNNDANNDDNGSNATGGVIRSGTVTLVSGNEPINDDDTNPNSNLTVDFGLFQPASLGSTVWRDTNSNGLRDSNEPGISGVTVILRDSNGTEIARTTTDSSGIYQFTNLIPGSYTVEFVPPPGLTFTLPNANNNGNDDSDSDVNQTTGRTQPIPLSAGQNIPTIWAGLVPTPQAIVLGSFTASRTATGVEVRWSTLAELNSAGFHVLRSTTGSRADAVRVTGALIPARGNSLRGAEYSWRDTNVQSGVTYTYWLEELELDGTTLIYGPARQTTGGSGYRMFFPFSRR
jgi:protocatechuate 3,4-dioxygenase beta subunit